MDIFYSFWDFHIVDLNQFSNSFFFMSSSYDFFFNIFIFDNTYTYFLHPYNYQSPFLLGYFVQLKAFIYLPFLINWYLPEDWYDIWIIHYFNGGYFGNWLEDSSQVWNYQIWYRNMCMKGTYWHFHKNPTRLSKRRFRHFRFIVPYMPRFWCIKCRSPYFHYYRTLWLYFLQLDAIGAHRIGTKWRATQWYGPLRAFFIYKKGWTPYHVYYFFNLNSNNINYFLFWPKLTFYPSELYEFILDYWTLFYRREVIVKDYGVVGSYLEFFWFPHLKYRLLDLTANFEWFIWFLFNFIIWNYWFWILFSLFCVFYFILRVPRWWFLGTTKILLFPIYLSNLWLDLIEEHHKVAGVSLNYRLLSFYDLKDTLQKFYLYLNRVFRFNYIILRKYSDPPKNYLFIMRCDFYISYTYLRFASFNFWRTYMRLIYIFIILPIISFFKYLYIFFFLNYDVLNLLGFIIYVCYYMFFFIKRNINYNIFYNLNIIILKIKNILAFATFFDFHFSLLRAIYFWFPKKYHFHDAVIFEKSYPALNHPWFNLFANCIIPIYFTYVSFIYFSFSNFVSLFISIFQFFFVLIYYLINKLIQKFNNLLNNKFKFKFIYLFQKLLNFFLRLLFVFDLFLIKKLFIVVLLFIIIVFYKAYFIVFFFLALLYFSFNMLFYYTMKNINNIFFIFLDKIFYFLGVIIYSIFSLFSQILKLFFVLIIQLFLKIPFIFLVFIFYLLVGFDFVLLYDVIDNFILQLFYLSILEFFSEFFIPDFIYTYYDWKYSMWEMSSYVKGYIYLLKDNTVNLRFYNKFTEPLFNSYGFIRLNIFKTWWNKYSLFYKQWEDFFQAFYRYYLTKYFIWLLNGPQAGVMELSLIFGFYYKFVLLYNYVCYYIIYQIYLFINVIWYYIMPYIMFVTWRNLYYFFFCSYIIYIIFYLKYIMYVVIVYLFKIYNLFNFIFIYFNYNINISFFYNIDNLYYFFRYNLNYLIIFFLDLINIWIYFFDYKLVLVQEDFYEAALCFYARVVLWFDLFFRSFFDLFFSYIRVSLFETKQLGNVNEPYLMVNEFISDHIEGVYYIVEYYIIL